MKPSHCSSLLHHFIIHWFQINESKITRSAILTTKYIASTHAVHGDRTSNFFIPFPITITWVVLLNHLCSNTHPLPHNINTPALFVERMLSQEHLFLLIVCMGSSAMTASFHHDIDRPYLRKEAAQGRWTFIVVSNCSISMYRYI